jgi:hypothetical protein
MSTNEKQVGTVDIWRDETGDYEIQNMTREKMIEVIKTMGEMNQRAGRMIGSLNDKIDELREGNPIYYIDMDFRDKDENTLFKQRFFLTTDEVLSDDY